MDRVIQWARRLPPGWARLRILSPSRLLAGVLLVAYAALLGAGLLDPRAQVPGGAALLDLQSVGGAFSLARRLSSGVVLGSLLFAPLGFLAVLALPDREARLGRIFRVALPALVVALALACAALGARAGWTRPGPFELLLPAAGILLGAWAGLAWRRGWWSRLLFLPKVALLGGVLLLSVLGLAALALQSEATVPEPAPITSAEKRHLVELFRGKDPRKIPDGESRTLRLDERELDRLVCWVAAVGARARTRVQLQEGGASLTAAVPVPRTRRWLNVHASARAEIEGGRLSLTGPRLRIGRVVAPSLLLDALAPFLEAGVQGDRDLRRVLPAVDSLRLAPDGLTLTYRRVDMPRGLLARLVWGDDRSATLGDSFYAYVDPLLERLEASPSGDARFGLALETAFGLARERSRPGSAVEENRVALLALGVVLGHPRLARAAGESLDEERRGAARRVRAGTTLRGRNDWVRHFTASGALTVLSSVSPSDAAGLLKEELDADGGSGFSFADLLADRAGTTFADFATRDETAAAALQARLGKGFRVEGFFPAADGLPEGIPDAELQARYGGVGGDLYRRYAGEIERRIAACEAYRD